MWFQKQKEPLKWSGFPRLKELVVYYKSEWLIAAKLKPSLADTPITVLGKICRKRPYIFQTWKVTSFFLLIQGHFFLSHRRSFSSIAWEHESNMLNIPQKLTWGLDRKNQPGRHFSFNPLTPKSPSSFLFTSNHQTNLTPFTKFLEWKASSKKKKSLLSVSLLPSRKAVQAWKRKNDPGM